MGFVSISSTPKGFSRRTALQAGLSGAGVALLAACAPATPPPAATTAPVATKPATAASPVASAAPSPGASPVASAVASPSAAPAALPGKVGGRVRYGSLDDITGLDGHVTSSPGYDTFFNIFDRLTQYDLKQVPQPHLAESWEVATDGKRIKLNIRKGVTFHTGRELTAEDVKWNMLRVRDPKVTTSTVGPQSLWFSTIDTPDKYTVILNSEQPRPAVFDFFEYLSIIDPVTMEGPDGRNKPTGTGPFTFKEWAQGDHLTLVKNKNYWASGLPFIDEMYMQVIKDPSALMAQFEAGQLDIVKGPPIQDFVRLGKDPKYQAVLEPEGRFFYLGANTTFKPLDNKKVRQALAHTIDRKRFVDTVSQGLGTAQSIPWPNFSPAYEAGKIGAYPFDLDKAKSLLAEAGVSNLEMDIYPVSLYPELMQFAVIQQADLAKIGVKLNIKNVDLTSWVAAIVGQKYDGLYSTAIGGTQLHPSTLMAGAAYKDPGNNSKFASPEYTAMLAQVATEPDATKAKAVYSKLNDMLIEEAFVHPIGTAPFRVVARQNVKNLNFLLHDAISFRDMWLDG